jgi:N6-L-threonylcarbamoyladenine synthase
MPSTPPTNSELVDKPPIRILGVETSCDETAAAVVEDGRQILSNVVASQIDLHAQFGGVFPEVASRQHIKTIYTVIDQALHQAHLTLKDLDAVAVTRGPGLPGSLVVGMNAAKGLVLGTGLPLIGVSHLEGHAYSAWLYQADTTPSKEPVFPLVALIVSGGHTELILMKDHLQYQHLGATLDDAAGEAFDKVARLLGLDYPGGPSIQNVSSSGNPSAYNFPRAWLDDSWDFSFSGLKTAVLREVNQYTQQKNLPVADLAASFQAAVVDVLVTKTVNAVSQFEAKSLVIAGGVSANRSLRHAIQTKATCPLHIPPIWLCTDNASMIAGAAYFRYIRGQRDSLDMDVLPNWPLSEVPAPILI